MKYTDEKNQDSQFEQPIPYEEKADYFPIEMQSQSDELPDKLQANVVNGCGRVLAVLETQEELKVYVKTDETEKIVNSLRDFHYTIGFAGGQSSGKSTVVNAMLQYPLMPTCQAATTCTPVELLYSERIRITVSDADTGKQLMDYPCDKTTDEQFSKLKKYACAVSALPQVIENLQPFVDGYVGDFPNGIHPDQLDMKREDSRHVAVLMMMLLTVYVKQNLDELTTSQENLINLRKETMAYFNLHADVPNIYVRIQWNSPILRSGLRILDLPGLGANAEDKKLAGGKVLKGHDTITKDAIALTDTMVVVQNPEMLASVLPTVKQMVSNLKIKEAVVENCIVPVLNKVDTCIGAAGRKNAIQNFQSILQNVGIQKEETDIFCLSAVYGEYAYEGCTRTLFCEKAIRDLTDMDDINDTIAFERKRLGKNYKGSGVEALREFFRTAFIERGKIEKSFSSIAEIRVLEKDAKSKILAQKQLYEGFAGANRALLHEAIPRLKNSANTPINDAISSFSEADITAKVELMTKYTALIANDYTAAFQKAAEEYETRNLNIISNLRLTWGGFGSFADISTAHPDNFRLYQEFKKESKHIYVDMTAVNNCYASTLAYIKADIEKIFQEAVSKLHNFADSYEPTLKLIIAEYGRDCSPEVIAIFESMIPIIAAFVEEQIEIAENGVNRASSQVEEAQIRIANTIVSKNYEFVSSIRNYALEHIQVKTTLLRAHTKIRIDGPDGAKIVLKEMKEIIGNSTTMNSDIQTVRGEITKPLWDWYRIAVDSATRAFEDLQGKVEELFNNIEKELDNNTLQNEEYSKRLDENREQIRQLFGELRESIRESVEQLLPIARERGIVSHKYEEELISWMVGGEVSGK